jgi:hypothetical protein
MKIKIRPHDPGVRHEADWLQMDGWLAKLRDDGKAGSAGDDHVQPAPGRDDRPEALAQPARAEAPARAENTESTESAGSAVRAVIGNQLRMPLMWCEMGSCISWRADPAALGEADARTRAISAGWRIDALGRLACPQCQQTDPSFWATGRVVRWDRYTAVAQAAAIRSESTVAWEGSRYPDAVGGSPSAGPPEPAWRQSAPPFPRRRS